MENICVFSKSFENHKNDLKSVFERLKAATLKLKPSKCHLFQNEIKFLGHKVRDKEIFQNLNEINAIKEMIMPTKSTK